MRKLIVFIFVICSHQASAQEVYNNFHDFMEYASAKSLDLKKGDIEFTKAKKLKLAAVLGILDPIGDVNLSYKNNVELPVTILPSEITGGPPGTVEVVQFGLQYETQLAANLEIKLLNLAGWSDMRLSKINIDLSEKNKQITRKELYESASKIYYNILTLEAQLLSTENNLKAADTIRDNVQMRVGKGLANQQHLNEAEVNRLNLQQSKSQIQYMLKQQYNALKTLCDIPDEEEFTIEHAKLIENQTEELTVTPNTLMLEHAQLSEEQAFSRFRSSQYAFAPTFSAIALGSRQQYNNESTLFDPNIDWFPGTYIGFKLNLPIPGYQQSSSFSNRKYDRIIAEENRKKVEIQIKNDAINLQDDYKSAVSDESFNQQIYLLKKDTYLKNILNYELGVADLDNTLKSFQEMVNAEYTWIASSLKVQLSKTKIEINNSIY